MNLTVFVSKLFGYSIFFVLTLWNYIVNNFPKRFTKSWCPRFQCYTVTNKSQHRKYCWEMSPNCPNQAMISETSFRCFVPGLCSRVWWADWRRKQLSPVSRAREATATGHYGVTGDSSRQDSSFPDYAQTGWAGRPGHAQLCRRHASSGQERVGCLKRRT